mmetsp:Transcript_1149/g.2205  ORF Transcript_1149/g.2205 Transcript_1149/m.2205 type:complete len:187 (-) Transcript_1149:165-725(-)
MSAMCLLLLIAAPLAESIVMKEGALQMTPDCTGTKHAGVATCDSLSTDKCEGFTSASAGTAMYVQCKVSGNNCLAVGPACNAPVLKHWIKGGGGTNCNSVCKAKGFSKCNKEKMTAINNPEKIKAAMKEAGYTCKSVGGSRNYAGSPFSTSRSGDDCYFVTSGTNPSSLSCSGNSYGHHSPLCYCE